VVTGSVCRPSHEAERVARADNAVVCASAGSSGVSRLTPRFYCPWPIVVIPVEATFVGLSTKLLLIDTDPF
jgi:hypothetical protein